MTTPQKPSDIPQVQPSPMSEANLIDATRKMVDGWESKEWGCQTTQNVIDFLNWLASEVKSLLPLLVLVILFT